MRVNPRISYTFGLKKTREVCVGPTCRQHYSKQFSFISSTTTLFYFRLLYLIVEKLDTLFTLEAYNSHQI